MWAIDVHDVDGAGAAPASLGIAGASATRAAAAATILVFARPHGLSHAGRRVAHAASHQAGNCTANASAINAARITLPSDV